MYFSLSYYATRCFKQIKINSEQTSHSSRDNKDIIISKFIHNIHRVSVSEKRSENGVSSQLSIAHAERHDSGVYRCRAENAYGRDELLIYLAVQGILKVYTFLYN